MTIDAGSDAVVGPCSGMPGDVHSAELQSGGETRYYSLHVPSDYACQKAWPLLVDFHGTGTGAPTDPVEESWAFDEMLAAADAEHFIVMRPRSRYKNINGENIFQWDINAGDEDRNRTFATELISDLETRYNIDPQRVYAAGFSNGPSQALEFLQNEPPIVHGYMVVSGGLNRPLTTPKQLTAADGRIYVSVGYRDYMWSTTRELYTFLTQHAFDMSRWWQRESNTGHELYGWHYKEAFAWIDRGERSAKGTVASGWSAETLPTPASITSLTKDSAGLVHAVGVGGAFRRSAAGAWTQTLSLGAAGLPLHLDSVCFLANGTGLAIGEASRYVTTDGLTWTAAPAIPEEYTDEGFGGAYINAIVCSGDTITAAGLWTAAHSADDGATWTRASVASYGAQSFVTTLRRSVQGTYLAAGYDDYLGRSTDGVTFVASTIGAEIQWWNDVAPDDHGGWWAVGEKGTLVHSVDDGANFTAAVSPTTEDLYAVSFRDALVGLIAGGHGAVFVTHDGGGSWTDMSTGLDGYIGAITWLDASRVLIAGEHGAVLKRSM